MADRQDEVTRRRKIFVKIIILGDARVGKTSLITRYDRNSFRGNNYRPTIGVGFIAKQLSINNEQVTLQIWDTAGQERFQSLGVAFYRGADCCILVYDVTNKTSFENLAAWKDDFFIQASPKNPEKFPIIVVGNKVDCEDTRQVSYERAQCWCDMNNMCYYETSAKDDINLDKLFYEVARKTLANEEIFK